jgi:hypothetical protein
MPATAWPLRRRGPFEEDGFVRFAKPSIVLALLLVAGVLRAELPALSVEILDAGQKRLGTAQVYLNYVELTDLGGAPKGAIGVVSVEGRTSLFLVQADSERRLIGWAEDHRLYDANNKLVGYYAWTPLWSYVYDEKLKKVGQARCMAYQGVCAAGIAGYLLGLF